MNQYIFLIFTVFCIDNFWNLYNGHLDIFLLLFIVGGVFFFVWRRTRLYDNHRAGSIVSIVATLVTLYLCLFFGFHIGILPYYFAILFAVFFIFCKKNTPYNIFVFIWVSVAFYLLSFSDFGQLSSDWNMDAIPIRSFHLTVIQTIVLFAINGYFMTLKISKVHEIYQDVVTNKYEPVRIPLNSVIEPSSLEYLVKLAQKDDLAFVLVFKETFPFFYDNLRLQKGEITKDEFKLCALLKLGFSTKEIANYNHLAIRSVQSKKARLRKSFKIPAEECLYGWVNQF